MFLNRETEIARLNKVLSSDTAKLVVIYGRRRCGKSTLLKKVLNDSAIYFAADMREATLQINALAQRIDKVVTEYQNWLHGPENLPRTSQEYWLFLRIFSISGAKYHSESRCVQQKEVFIR